MKKIFLTLCLSVCLLASQQVLAKENAGEAKVPDIISGINGNPWMKASKNEKLSFLYGLETAVTIEYYINNLRTEKAAKAGKRPVSSISPFERGWREALGDKQFENVIDKVDQWYKDNPDKLNRPVMHIIWYELIAPNLKAKAPAEKPGKKGGKAKTKN